MSAVALEQVIGEEFIFGDHLLHVRFFTAIELLAQVVLANPRPVSAAALAEGLGQPPRMIRGLLLSLNKAGLVCQDEKVKDAWYCAGALSEITLADIFRCVSATTVETSAAKKRKSLALEMPVRTGTQQSVDLLLMQATMAVNQVVLQHLQQFDLGRLRAVASAAPFRVLSKRAGAAYNSEPC